MTLSQMWQYQYQGEKKVTWKMKPRGRRKKIRHILYKKIRNNVYMQALLVNTNLVDFKKSFNYDSEKFQFRWLNIKGFDTAFPISITLCSNQLKLTSSQKKKLFGKLKMADVEIKMTVFVAKCLIFQSWKFSKIMFWKKHVIKNQVIIDLEKWVGNIINLEKSLVFHIIHDVKYLQYLVNNIHAEIFRCWTASV